MGTSHQHFIQFGSPAVPAWGHPLSWYNVLEEVATISFWSRRCIIFTFNHQTSSVINISSSSEVRLCQPRGHPLSWYNLPKKWRLFLFGPEDASSSPSIIKLHQSSTYYPVRKSSCTSLGAIP